MDRVELLRLLGLWGIVTGATSREGLLGRPRKGIWGFEGCEDGVGRKMLLSSARNARSRRVGGEEWQGACGGLEARM